MSRDYFKNNIIGSLPFTSFHFILRGKVIKAKYIRAFEELSFPRIKYLHAKHLEESILNLKKKKKKKVKQRAKKTTKNNPTSK